MRLPTRRGLFGRASAGPGANPLEQRVRGTFFTAAWIYGAVGLLLVGMASGRQSLTLLALLVLVTAGLARAWNHVSLMGVTFTHALSADRALPGDQLTLTLSVVNRKPLPLPWLAVEQELSDSLTVLDRETMPSGTVGRQVVRITTNIRPYERVTWRIALHCQTRGVHPVGPALLRAGDPFGFFSNRLPILEWDRVLVYPQVIALPDLGFPTRLPVGETRIVRHLLTDPTRVVGVRDYQPEDPFRSIHWKATARQGDLQVRVYEPTTALQLGIFANLDTFTHYWEGLDVELADRAITVAASLASWGDGQRYAVGVYANGIVARSDQTLRIPPGRGPSQITRIMEGLAMVMPYSTLNFTKTLRAESARFPWGSTLAIITSQLPEPLLATLSGLIAAGHRVVLIPLGDCPAPELRGLVVRRVENGPPSPPIMGGARTGLTPNFSSGPRERGGDRAAGPVAGSPHYWGAGGASP